MKIAGLVKSSLIDYPGKVAAVVFTQGCNFRCGFCHNPDLISIQYSASGLAIPEAEVIEFLEKRKGQLDGVVITGGEPLVQPGIEDFIIKVRSLGFKIKLDTNGSNPEKLEKLIDQKLIDYIAMDIKGPLSKYPEICAYLNTKVIQQSINIIMNSNVEYEFRTTVLPACHELTDFEEIGKLIRNAEKYTIQGFRSKVTLNSELANAESFSISELGQISEIMTCYVQKVDIHPNI